MASSKLRKLYYDPSYDKKRGANRDSCRDVLESDEIRILKLFPGVDSDLQGNLLRCKFDFRDVEQDNKLLYSNTSRTWDEQPLTRPPGLTHTSGVVQQYPPKPGSTDLLSYRALSYTWGSGVEKESIKIIEGGNIYEIDLKPNLSCVLRKLREQHSTDIIERKDDKQPALHLWVDAICIDQKDEDEKSKQIPQMADIYMRAEEVCCWLGPEDQSSSLAIDFVNDKCLNFDETEELVKNRRYSKEWDSFATLLRRPWFSRRWIVQELTRAQNAIIYCGDKKVVWRKFADAITLFQEVQDQIKPLFHKSELFGNDPDYIGDLNELSAIRLVHASEHLFRRDEQGRIAEKLLTLEALMSTLTAFEASEPKDTVYAILWLAKDARPVSDYKKKDYKVKIAEQKMRRIRLQDDRESSFSGFGEPNDDSAPPKSPIDGTIDKNPSDEIVIKSPIDGISSKLLLSMDRANREEGSQKSEGENDEYKTIQAFNRLLKGIHGKRFDIDYKKTLFEVCCNFLEFCIKNSSSIDIICRPWAPDPTIEELKKDGPLPTWIRRLSTDAPFAKLPSGILERVNADPLVGRPGTDERKHYNADRAYIPTFRTSPENPRVLLLRGFILDAVKAKGDPARGAVIPDEWLTMAGWLDREKLPPERFWRTLVGNRTQDGDRAPALWARTCKEAFAKRAQGGDLDIKKLISSMSGKTNTIKPFLERVKAVTFKRCLLTLQSLPSRQLGDEHLALGPQSSKVGDIIAVVHGCSVPLLFRMVRKGEGCQGDDGRERPPSYERIKWEMSNTNKPLDDDDIYYQFLGECYVHGMMDGEALSQKNILKDQEFHII